MSNFVPLCHPVITFVEKLITVCLIYTISNSYTLYVYVFLRVDGITEQEDELYPRNTFVRNG